MPKIKGTKNIKKSDPHQNYCLDITKNGDIEDLLLETHKIYTLQIFLNKNIRCDLD